MSAKQEDASENAVLHSERTKFWLNDWEVGKKTLTSLRRFLPSFPTLRIMRVSQLDADLLDFELFEILKEQLWQMFSLFRPQFKETFEPELLALLHLIIYRLSIYESGASYGAQLQNLNYRDERKHAGGSQSAKDAPLAPFQKYAFGIMTVGGQYTWTRLNRLLTARGWSEYDDNNPRKIVWKILQKMESAYRIFSLVNFLAFLYNGRYRNLIDRFLSMRLVYTRRSSNRQISFEFLNRQLVWHAFTEFLLFLMPLINLKKFKNIVHRTLLPESYSKYRPFDFLPVHTCAICYENQLDKTMPGASANSTRLHNPYETNCGHRYCYCCIKTKLIQEGGSWRCLRCGEEVREITRILEKVINENV